MFILCLNMRLKFAKKKLSMDVIIRFNTAFTLKFSPCLLVSPIGTDGAQKSLQEQGAGGNKCQRKDIVPDDIYNSHIKSSIGEPMLSMDGPVLCAKYRGTCAVQSNGMPWIPTSR